MQTRRHFLKQAALTGTTTAFTTLNSTAQGAAGPQEFCFFSKHFPGIEFNRLADITASIGATGIEAPVRPGGQVEPERVEEDLPKLVEALKKSGCNLAILTSGITEVSAAQHTEKVLRTAKALGVQRYRMGFCKYDLKQPILPQLDAWSAKFKALIALSKEIGIQPLLQNHSGKEYVGAPVWDVFSIMKDYPAKDWSFAFDIMHATIEGSLSWPLEVNLVRDHIGAAYFKDFKWGSKRFESCPFGEGVVSKDYVGMLKKSGYRGPVSLHVEYLDAHLKEPTYLETAIAATKRDFAKLKEWWL
jgi:sugar phosphate isomerase/epimerase